MDKSPNEINELSRSELIPHGAIENVRRPEVFFKIAKSILGADLRNKRLLDVACGDNFLLRDLVEAGASYLGIEARQANIDNAWKRIPEHMRDRVRFERGVAQDVSASAHGTFDLVLVAGLIYHLSPADQFALLTSLRDVCGSALVIDTSLTPEQNDTTYYYAINGCIYSGTGGLEHGRGDSKSTIEERLRASYSDSGEYPSFIQTRSCLIRMLRNLGYDQVLEYCYPGNLNDFNMAIALDNVQTVGAFRPNLRRVFVAPTGPGLSAPHTGAFTGIEHDGKYGSIGKRGLAQSGEAIERLVTATEADSQFVRALDHVFQMLPLKLNYVPLAHLIARDLPIPLIFRFFKGYIDPVIRYGSPSDRERALALFVALLRKTDPAHRGLADYAVESFISAYAQWYPSTLPGTIGKARAGKSSARKPLVSNLDAAPIAVPNSLIALLGG